MNAWIIQTDGAIEHTSLAKMTLDGSIRKYVPLNERQHGLKAFNVSIEADSMTPNEDAPRLLGMPSATGILGSILLIQRAMPVRALDQQVAAALGGDLSAMREFNLYNKA